MTTRANVMEHAQQFGIFLFLGKKFVWVFILFGWKLFVWCGRNTMQEFFVIKRLCWAGYFNVLNFILVGG